MTSDFVIAVWLCLKELHNSLLEWANEEKGSGRKGDISLLLSNWKRFVSNIRT